MSFYLYDIIFLVVFTLFIIWFLYTRKRNLKREGLLYLYRTSWGIKLINYFGDKYKGLLKVLSYISITLGYLLMGGIIYLFGKIVYIYIAFPEIVRAIKVPPIMPLIPYLPKVFNLTFLPPFYFTYWIIILAIIAIPHEFAHGIFMRLYNVRIKSTGFGFLGPFLAAFVEQDEQDLENKSKFQQLAILSAGTFANVLTAIFFFFILWGFFSMTFVASGVQFDTYSYSLIDLQAVKKIDNINVQSPTYQSIADSFKENNKINITTNEGINYILLKETWLQQNANQEKYLVYDDAPAINYNLFGVIKSINGEVIDDTNKLSQELNRYSSGDEVVIITEMDDGEKEFTIRLDENSQTKKPWLGVAFIETRSQGIIGKVYTTLSSFKNPHVYYKPINEFSLFIYNLLWWVILISISVALVNMLPVGIFDGGRFFYLTILFFTNNKNVSKKIFSIMTYFFLILVFLLMVFWAKSFF